MMDITDTDAVRGTLTALAPTAIVNAAAYTAAYTAVDKAEEDAELAARVNGAAPGVLADVAGQTGACFVHYSTDYVFDGSAARPYRESDPVAPINAYGRTKLAGERAVLEYNDAAIILRTCWVYSNRGRNFLLTVRRLARERGALRIVDDQCGCPTSARFIAEATAAILAGCGLSAARLRECSGIYHLAASGETSWCGFARAIIRGSPGCEGVKVEGIPASEYPTPARRPAYSVLDTSLLCETFGLWMPRWELLLAQVLEDARA
jgi:dTDP-4-dehydrorhamnose reductase